MSAYDEARSGCAVQDLSAREHLVVTGPDRVSYLHGMVTNDVEGLQVGGSNYAALLTAKGAMVGDARVLRRADDLVLDTGPGRAASLLEFLHKYLISEDAEVSVSAQFFVIGLVGPKALEVAAPLEVAGRFESFLGGVDLLVERSKREATWALLSGLPVLDDATSEVLRVERGAALFGVDMTEATIPLEANLERAVSYHKGCYIGQEVIARATYRGQMNKRLVGVTLGESAPVAKTELQLNGKKVGWLTSVVHSARLAQRIGLAYVHRDHLAPGTTLDVATGGTAVVHALPF